MIGGEDGPRFNPREPASEGETVRTAIRLGSRGTSLMSPKSLRTW